jgi:hypothetical protein
MGTIVNAISIVVGSIIGFLLKKGIEEKYQAGINMALGLSVVVIAVNGIITNCITVEGTKLKSDYELLIVIALIIGVYIGEKLSIQDNLNGLSEKIEKKFNLSGFAKSFVTGTIIYCVGAMAIIGALNDGLLHDPSVLYIKSILDGITSIILSATMGIGVLFSAIPVLIYQGTITLLANNLQSVLQGDLLNQICAIGYILVLCIGLNFMKVTKIKTANFLPSLLIPVLWYCINLFI